MLLVGILNIKYLQTINKLYMRVYILFLKIMSTFCNFYNNKIFNSF